MNTDNLDAMELYYLKQSLEKIKTILEKVEAGKIEVKRPCKMCANYNEATAQCKLAMEADPGHTIPEGVLENGCASFKYDELAIPF